MSQPPQPMLDRKFSDEFTAGMTDSLELWCRNTPTPTRIELLRFLAGGKTTAKVAVVRVYDHRGVTIRVVKHCPRPEGGAGVSLDARKYHDAESASQKFTQAHLAKLDEFVPDGNGGIFLLMEWRGGGSRNHQPLTAFLDRQELDVACRAIVKSTLIDWQKDSRKPPDRGSVYARALLQTIAGEKCLPGRSLHTIAADLGIADADRLEANGTAFANIFRAVSQGEGFADFQTAGIRGNGHGDLHPGNILVPVGGARPVTAAAQFDKYYLIDLSSFAPDRFLAIDPAHLTLSIANEWLGRLNPQQGRQLRELILDPTQADSGSLPLCIAKAVPAIARVGREHYDDGSWGLFDDWSQETLLAIAGCALLFVGRNTDDEARWWFLQLGGMAIDKLGDAAISRQEEQAADDRPLVTTVTKPGDAIGPSTAPAQQRMADAGPHEEQEDGSLVYISAVARRFGELRSACSQSCAELREAVDGLDPHLAKDRGILGTSMIRHVLGDLTHSVAALRGCQEESQFRGRLAVDSAIAIAKARLDTAAEITHEISVAGSTPTQKNNLIQAATELDGAFRYFFALIVADQGDRR